MKNMTASEFEAMTGRPSENDDLERVNCQHAGTLGHYSCGWCWHCAKPVYECGHTHKHDLVPDPKWEARRP